MNILDELNPPGFEPIPDYLIDDVLAFFGTTMLVKTCVKKPPNKSNLEIKIIEQSLSKDWHLVETNSLKIK